MQAAELGEKLDMGNARLADIQVVLEHNRTSVGQSEKAQADMMTKINAIYASLEPARRKGGKKGIAVTELGREAVTIKKGKAGKLGRGSHGIVKKGELETDSGRIPVAIKVVAVDDEEARQALQRELEILVSFLWHFDCAVPRNTAIYAFRHRCGVPALSIFLGQAMSSPSCFPTHSSSDSRLRLSRTINNEEEDELWVVLEFCELGSLERILRVCNGTSSQTELSALLEAMPEITASNENATAAVQQQLCTLFGGQLPGFGAAFFHLAKDIVRGVMYLHSKGIAHSDLKAANILIDKGGSARVADFGVRLPFLSYAY